MADDAYVTECAWCEKTATTQAKHADGELYPSCGVHGTEILPEPEWVDDVKIPAPPAQPIAPGVRVLDVPNHNRNTWRKGCRCNECRADHRLDLRERRAKKKQDKQAAAEAEERKKLHYPTLIAVQKQLNIIKAEETNPGVAAICIQMAKILDDPAATPQQPAAAGKLLDALKELGVQPRKPGANLTAVREMVNKPKRPATASATVSNIA